MKTLNDAEIELVARALRYALKDTHTFTKDHTDLCALIEKLDPQPVKKVGYILVYSDGTRSYLFDYQYDAEQWARNAPDSRVVKVTWEE